jgi:methyltransferase (TIGR00027 family)
LIDPAPRILDDQIGLRLASPPEDWRLRPDMSPEATRRVRATAVARSRFVEDLVEEKQAAGFSQYVLLAAGLDSFALRKLKVLTDLDVYEVDSPAAQEWKRKKLSDLGLDIPRTLRFAAADVARGEARKLKLEAAGFDTSRPAVVGSCGDCVYQTREALVAMLQEIASLASGTILVLSFQLPLELVDADERPQRKAIEAFARVTGTPFRSLFSPAEALQLAQDAGFREVLHVPAAELTARYFGGRSDGLRPSSAEDLLVATV